MFALTVEMVLTGVEIFPNFAQNERPIFCMWLGELFYFNDLQKFDIAPISGKSSTPVNKVEFKTAIVAMR